MNVTEARKWIVLSSLIITGSQMGLFLIAPDFGFPLQYPQNMNLIQIISPVFLGYLGSATHFIFQNPPPAVPVQNEFLGMLVRGPILIYVFVVCVALAAFA